MRGPITRFRNWKSNMVANRQLNRWNALVEERQSINRRISSKLREIQDINIGWKRAGMTREEANTEIRKRENEVRVLKKNRPLDFRSY